MKGKYKRSHTLLSFFVIIGIITGCNGWKTWSETPVPVPDDLSLYFEDLLMDSVNYCIDESYDWEVEHIFRSITLLQDYNAGKTDTYPAWSIKEALGDMAYRITRAEAEGISYNCNDECNALCLSGFLEAYLDQVLRLCPDIRLLFPLVSDDQEVAVFNFDHIISSYYAASYDAPTYIIYRDTGKIYRKKKWLTGSSYNRIYQVGRNGKRYYLLVNLHGYHESLISLVSLEDGKIKECLEPTDWNIRRLMHEISYSEYHRDEFPETVKLIFNPEELTWKECVENQNGYWITFPGSRTFKIEFGKKISLVME